MIEVTIYGHGEDAGQVILVNATRAEWRDQMADLLCEDWFTLNSIYGTSETFQSCHIARVSAREVDPSV